ncbi:MAG: RNase adapter RapZ [Deltaproteobacteria bacterium]|nr:RNase adapter RapZ [Deltaproteobacteria bacterium]
MKDIRLVVLSGASGAGKSTAIKALEDVGFFCVDNLPVTLLPKFMEVLSQSGEITKVAAVVDVREGEFLKAFSGVFAGIKKDGYRVELLYLEAEDDSLVRRFSETRRRHPIAAAGGPLEGILKERGLLNEIKSLADRVVDTTGFNVHQLREHIKGIYSGATAREKMTVNVVSFGYRYGIPADADLVVDIRFLPNPYFVEELRPLDGGSGAVRGFVLGRPETTEFLERFKAFLDYLMPMYRKEGKAYLTIAVGCTGGRHRSVVIADEVCLMINSPTFTVQKRHRDIQKP